MNDTDKRAAEVAFLRKEAADWSRMNEGLVAAVLEGCATKIERGEHLQETSR